MTLATGTGKTAIAFQIAWKLFHSRWNLAEWKSLPPGSEPTRRPRILFLADRNNLADQACNAFSAFEDRSPGTPVRIAPDEIRRKGRVPKNGSVFFTIFQTFMSGTGQDGQALPYFGEYPAEFFDLIVIDECHRGGAHDESNWRAILDHFSPAVQLGLTTADNRCSSSNTTTPSPMPWPSWASLTRCGGCLWVFRGICTRRVLAGADLGKKTVRNEPLRSIRSRRSPSPTGS